MKKIINGKMYNTETAKVLGEDWEGCTTDIHYWREKLYQKKNGEFFLHGEGGAYSRWGEQHYGYSCGGENIEPLTDGEAREWGEKHLTADEYIEVFGEVDE